MSHVQSFATPDGVVEADIEFLVPSIHRPFGYGGDPRPEDPAPSATFERRRVRIRDVRDGEAPSLDANGAELMRSPTRVRNFYDDDELTGRYYPESADIIRAALGASRVVVYDHNVRRGARLALRPDRYDQGRPVHHAHTDYTPASAQRRLGDEFGPAAAAQLARRRWLQVNLWRPLRAPLRDAPLALCDAASLAPASLRATELRYPDRCGELYYLSHEAAQRWFYAADMGVDEAWLFKNFDSAAGVATAAPHSAFEDPRPHPHVPPRESIEVRAFAFFEA